MNRLFTRGAGQAVTLTALLVLGGCGGSPPGLAPDERSLDFVDGPVDHVVGAPIPPFRVWVLDIHRRRATSLQGGTITLDLIGPGGAVQDPGFATANLSFGQGTFAPSVSLAQADGYRIRATYAGTTGDSPPFSVVAAPDVVRMSNPSAGEMGVLVDGANNIVPLQDSTHRTRAAQTDVGVLNSGILTHEVGVFAPDRRAELVPIAWTAQVDTLTIALRDPVQLPVTVWVVGGIFADVEVRVEDALAELSEAWRRERAGVTVGEVQVMDATALEPDFGFFAVGMGAPFATIQNGVGRAAGRFNIYVVSQIRAGGELVGGFAEMPGTAIAVTDSALASLGPRAVGHELGHNFGLRHTDGVEGFEIDANMMDVGGSTMVLTEGQTFRVHFNRSSPLGAFRTGDTFESRSCDPIQGNPDCPALGLRIWSESEAAAASVARRAAGGRPPHTDWDSSASLACGVVDR